MNVEYTTDLIVTVSADTYLPGENIQWYVFQEVSTELSDASGIVIGDFVNSASSFEWRASYPIVANDTDYISISGTTYNPILVSAVTETQSMSAYFYPLAINLIVTNEALTSIELSANWKQVSPGTDLYDITEPYMTWSMYSDTFNVITSSAFLSAIPYTLGDIESTPSATLFSLSADGADGKHFYITSSIYDTSPLSAYRQSTQTEFVLNPVTKFTLQDQDLNVIYADSFYDNTTQSFQPGQTLRWKLVPPDTSNVTVSAPGDSNYSVNGYGPVMSTDDLRSIRIETTNFIGSYQVYLSSYNFGDEWINDQLFEPYLYLEDAASLSGTLVETIGNPPESLFTLNIYGLTSYYGNDQFFRIKPDQLISYIPDPSNPYGMTLFKSNNSSPYIPSNIESVSVINPLYIRITTPVVTELPRVSSFFITCSAAETEHDYTVQIDVGDWITDTNLHPIFSINYESSSTSDIYRDYSDIPSWPMPITIHNRSVLSTQMDAEYTGTYTFIFSNGSPNIDQSSSFSSFVYNLPDPGASGTSVTISMSCEFLPSNPIYAPQRRYGDSKTLNIVDVIPTAEFDIFPQYKWDSGLQSFVEVLCSTSLTPGPCAWGSGHTEQFTLSALQQSTADYYYWYIDNKIPAPITLRDRVVDTLITSNQSTSSHGVSMKIVNDDLPLSMPNQYYDDTTGLLHTYKNFTTTNTNVSQTKDKIKMVSFNDFLGDSEIITNPLIGVSAEPLTVDILQIFSDEVPVYISNTSTATWIVSTYNWNIVSNEIASETSFSLTVTDKGLDTMTIYKMYPSLVNVSLELHAFFTPINQNDPFNDWNILQQTISVPDTQVSAYPLKPYTYTSNKFVLTGDSVTFENLVPYVSNIDSFTWTDRAKSKRIETTAPYSTSYTENGLYNISFTTSYSANNTILDESRVFENIITVLPEFNIFDISIDRVYQVTKLVLPYRSDECRVSPNEWITSENINKSFDRLNSNLQYLDTKSKLYDKPPTEYYGWLGTMNEGYDDRFYWRVNQEGLDTNHTDSVSAISDVFTNNTSYSVVSVPGVGDNIAIMSDSTTVRILSSDVRSTEIDRRTYKGIGDNFVNVVDVELDNNFGVDNRIYILDSGRNRIMVFSYNFDISEWLLLYDWGGLGSHNAKSKFRSPKGLFIDHSNSLWVADTGNSVVKKYTRTGSWLATLQHESFAANPPLDVAVDLDGYVYVLTNSGVSKFTSDLEIEDMFYISAFSTSIPKKLALCKDDGFVYICCESSVIKLRYDGVIVGTFATDNNSYTNIYHDNNRNLYITTPLSILKYIDKLDLVNLRLDSEDVPQWTTEFIHIKRDEYIQDWVLNKIISRFWDNLEAFRRSINGKFDFVVEGSTLTPKVRSFTPTEYKLLPFHKNQIYLGVNEVVTADAINRCIDKLYACEETILELIKD